MVPRDTRAHGGRPPTVAEDLLSSAHRVAAVAAAIEAYGEMTRRRARRLTGPGASGTQAGTELIQVRVATPEVDAVLAVREVGPSAYCVSEGTTPLNVTYERLDPTRRLLLIDDEHVPLMCQVRPGSATVTLRGTPIEVAIDRDLTIRAPFPAVVTRELATLKASVEAGAPLLALESMKLEVVVKSPTAGTVQRLPVRPGDRVAAGQEIVGIAPRSRTSTRAVLTEPTSHTRRGKTVVGPSAAPLSLLWSYCLGWDREESEYRVALAHYISSGDDPSQEVALVEAFLLFTRLVGPSAIGDRPTCPVPGADLLMRVIAEPHHSTAGLPQEYREAFERAREVYAHIGPDATDIAITLTRLRAVQHRLPHFTDAVIAVLQRWTARSHMHANPSIDLQTVHALRHHSDVRVRKLAADLIEAPRAPVAAAPPVPASGSRIPHNGSPAVEEAYCGREAPAAEPPVVDEPSTTGPEPMLREVGALNHTPLTRSPLGSAHLLGDPVTGAHAVACFIDGVDLPGAPHLESIRAGIALARSARNHHDVPHPCPVVVLVHLQPDSSLAPDPESIQAAVVDAADADVKKIAFYSSATSPTTHVDLGVQGMWTMKHDQPLAAALDVGELARLPRAHRRGLPTPLQVGEWLADGGTFEILDLDAHGRLVPTTTATSEAGVVVGEVSTPTSLHPQGIRRLVLIGNHEAALGAIAERECRRVIATIDAAQRADLCVDWVTISSGARISMDSGTENMDWVAAVLRRIIEFTQSGGRINILVAGINVGAQPYWNAEATMLMHTRGILIMTPASSMVLTGKRSLDFSGAVSAEDDRGIGGYHRTMGPNGQAQYLAADLQEARSILHRHHDLTYVHPGESGPRRVVTADPPDRDISTYPHPTAPFTTVGQIFTDDLNADRKAPFDIRTVMAAVVDQDTPPLERWCDMADAGTAVVLDARIGGGSACVVGIESHSVPRATPAPFDGPEKLSAGTLFPRSSKKVARAINSASGNRPVVVLANLSGFDGSPDSLRNLQLEYGAEIGRAVTNFRGRIVFCVLTRYHGGAFVVFSKRLNPELTVIAVEGARASVIGGAPAANVVFNSEVRSRTASDDRIRALRSDMNRAPLDAVPLLSLELEDLTQSVWAEKVVEVADEFDTVHSIDRAIRVGSVDRVVPPSSLRRAVIETLAGAGQRGDDRTTTPG